MAESNGDQGNPENIVTSFSYRIENIARNRFEERFSTETIKPEVKDKEVSKFRRSSMAEDILREANNSTLTMALIGCLPDNVQQAIKSFSIRPGKQHITLSFPFMSDVIRRFKHDVTPTADGVVNPQVNMTQALFFDHSIEVIDGYQTYVTLAPAADRESMPVVLFTLYQKDTREGILRHYESLIRILLDNKSLLSLWKMPLSVIDLEPSLLTSVIETCAQTIVEIQKENLLNTFPGKSTEELVTYVKEKMVVPYVRSYQEIFELNFKEVLSKLRLVEPERLVAVVEHVRSVACTTVDYQKADMMMKSPTTDPLIRCFWKVWGQEQLACKVFPVAMASRNVNKVGSFFYTVKAARHNPLIGHGFTNVSIKEGLHSIIKGLKSQDATNENFTEKPEMGKNCFCQVCKASVPSYSDLKLKPAGWESTGPGVAFEVHSAFYRPTPGSKHPRLHQTTTPYSDALKAAAIYPSYMRTPNTPHCDTLSLLREEFRKGYPYHAPPAAAPYMINTTPFMDYRLANHSQGTMPYPIVYKPRIITQDPTFSQHL